MRKLWNQFLNLFKRFKSPKTEADASLNKCDFSIFCLILFIVVYGIFVSIYPQKSHLREILPVVVNVRPDKFAVPNNPEQFVEGEFVGVKYFGVCGVIAKKKLQIGGYMYEILYKDKTGILQKIEVEKWLLFVPDRDSLISDALKN